MNSTFSAETLLMKPASWISKERLVVHDIFDNDKCQSLINQNLIRQCGLSIELPEVEVGSFLDVFIQNWLFLPKISKLLACRRHRAALMYQQEFENLPQPVREFCLTDCIDIQPIIKGKRVTEDYLYACGAQMLMNLSVHLPPALIQRIPLLFNESIMGFKFEPHPKPLPLLDFRLAIQHAKFSCSF